jgi:hypothetical protein
MTSVSRPTDRERLVGEIERTRADLGGTVEALAAKTDVTTRAKQAAGDTAVQARKRIAAAGESTARFAGSTKERLAEASRRPAVRRSLPPAAIATVLAVGAAIVVVRRRRSR